MKSILTYSNSGEFNEGSESDKFKKIYETMKIAHEGLKSNVCRLRAIKAQLIKRLERLKARKRLSKNTSTRGARLS